MLGETNFQNQKELVADFDLEEKEIVNRLREDPLLIIKKMELKHMKIVDEYNKKRDEFIRSKIKPQAIEKNTKFRRSSLSRSPEGWSDQYFSYNSKHSHNSIKHNRTNKHGNGNKIKNENYFSKSQKEEKLRNMVNYGKLIQIERSHKFNAKNVSEEKPAKNHDYLQEMRNKVNQKQISSLEQRMKFMKN